MEKTKGRKRHIVTDMMGNLLSIVIHAANIHDTKSGGKVFASAVEKYPTIKGVCADAGYRKSFENDVKAMDKSITISKKIKPEGWHILPKRWIVERTFAWLTHSRRLSKDYEISVDSAETMVKISHTATLLRRLTAL